MSVKSWTSSSDAPQLERHAIPKRIVLERAPNEEVRFIGANKSKSAPEIVSVEPDLELPVTELADQRVCRFELQLSTYIIYYSMLFLAQPP
jgi:hypothetical protein